MELEFHAPSPPHKLLVLYIVKAALHHSPLALVSSQGSQLNIIIIFCWRSKGSSWPSGS